MNNTNHNEITHETLKTKYKYVISYNTNHTTTKQMFFKGVGCTDDRLNKIINKGGSIFEYIGLNSIVKPYIDYDYIESDVSDFKTTRLNILKQVVNIFIDTCNIKLSCDLTINNITILDGCREIDGKYKFSFHITTKDNTHCFKTQKDAKQLHYLMKEIEEEQNGIVSICSNNKIDKGVYGKTQHLRTINGSKNINDKTKLTPIDVNGNVLNLNDVVFSDYMVNYTDDDYKLIVNTHNSNSIKLCEPICEDGNVNTSILDTYNILDHKGVKFNTDYRNDIEPLLIKKGIKKPNFQYAKEYNGVCNYYYTYENNTKCIYGNEHSRNNRDNPTLFVYEMYGVLFCGCFGGKCQNKKRIILGSVLIKSPLECSKYAIQVNEPKLTMKTENKTNKVIDVMNDFIHNNNKKVVCIKSRCGTGKTHTTCEYIRKYIDDVNNDARIIMISTRQSYARSMCHDMKYKHNLTITNYLDWKEEHDGNIEGLKDEPRICISLESLHYVIKDWKPYDIVIFDESESICRHIFSTTIDDGELRTYGLLQDIVKYSKKVFVLDADLSDASMRLVYKVGKEGNNEKFSTDKFTLINNTYSKNKRKYTITQDVNSWMLDIKGHILTGKKLFIVVLSKKKAMNLYGEIEEIVKMFHDLNGTKYTNDDVKLITGGMGYEDKKNMKNVNTDWLKCRVVITNSATGAGIDFSMKGHFDYIMARLGMNEYCCGISTPAELLQICHRVRHPNNNTISILSDNKMRIPYTFEYKKDTNNNITHTSLKETKGSSFIYTINNAKKYIDCVKQTIIKEEILKSVYNIDTGNIEQVQMDKDEDFTYLQYYEHLNTRLNNGANNYLLVLQTLIQRHGDVCTIEPFKFKQQRTKKDKTKNIYNDTKFNGETIESIHKKKNKTAKDQILYDKYVRLKKELNIDETHIDDDLLDIHNIFDSSNHKSMYYNAKMVHMEKEKQIKTRETKPTNKYDGIKAKIQQNKLNVYRRIIHYSKYDYTNDFVLTADQYNNMLSKIHLSDEEHKSINFRTNMDLSSQVSKVLENFGISIKVSKYTRIKNPDKESKKKRVNTPKEYTMNPKKEVYELLHIGLKQKSKNNYEGYDHEFTNGNFIKAVMTYDKYNYLTKPKKMF